MLLILVVMNAPSLDDYLLIVLLRWWYFWLFNLFVLWRFVRIRSLLSIGCFFVRFIIFSVWWWIISLSIWLFIFVGNSSIFIIVRWSFFSSIFCVVWRRLIFPELLWVSPLIVGFPIASPRITRYTCYFNGQFYHVVGWSQSTNSTTPPSPSSLY